MVLEHLFYQMPETQPVLETMYQVTSDSELRSLMFF